MRTLAFNKERAVYKLPWILIWTRDSVAAGHKSRNKDFPVSYVIKEG